MLVSVIVPVYNTEPFLEECIQSIVNQTYKELEIIIINDGSTDGSAEICKKWEQLDERIVYIEKENEGQGIARNLGIQTASGDYIIFVDSDDYIDKDLVGKVYNYILEQNADICLYAHYSVGDDIYKENLDFKLFQGNCVRENKELLGRLISFLCTKMFAASLIKNVNITMSNHICEDLVFNAQLYMNAKKICMLDCPLYYYRYKREGNLSTDYYRCLEIEQSMDELNSVFRSKNWFDSYWMQLYNVSFDRMKDALLRIKKRTDLEIPPEIKEKYPLFVETYKNYFERWFSPYLNIDLQKKNYLLVGSYNLRVIIHTLLLDEELLKEDYGSSSIISLMSKRKDDEILIENCNFKNGYRKKCVRQDIEKIFCRKEDFQEIDYIVIDLLEEILSLIKINDDCYITESEFLHELDLQELKQYERIPFFSEERRNLFTKYVYFFAEKIKSLKLPVIIIRNFLCVCHSIYYDISTCYENAEEINKTNIELEWYYQHLSDCLPDAIVVDASDFQQLVFTHENFLYGCKPVYYNAGYYQRMAIQLGRMVQEHSEKQLKKGQIL